MLDKEITLSTLVGHSLRPDTLRSTQALQETIRFVGWLGMVTTSCLTAELWIIHGGLTLANKSPDLFLYGKGNRFNRLKNIIVSKAWKKIQKYYWYILLKSAGSEYRERKMKKRGNHILDKFSHNLTIFHAFRCISLVYLILTEPIISYVNTLHSPYPQLKPLCSSTRGHS